MIESSYIIDEDEKKGITNMSTKESINRRDFLKNSISLGMAAFGAAVFPRGNKGRAAENVVKYPDLVAVRNGEPDVMYQKAIKVMGGMQRYVSKGQVVTVKPNIGWAREPELAADTNPLLVKTIIESCYAAGAKKVYVYDHTCHDWKRSYQLSMIEKYAKEAGAQVVSGDDERYYQEVRVPGAKVLKQTKVHELFLDSDVIVNVPVIKHHGSSQITVAMKNLMGVVWDRGYYHRNGLHRCITEFCLYRTPQLNIADGYRVTMDNGPQRARPEDIKLTKMLLISEDIVALDTAAARVLKADPGAINHIKYAAEKNIGHMNLDELNIKRIAL